MRAQGSEQPGFVIRCDGSATIGMGHVTRCLSLAMALRSRGACIRFATRDQPGSALAILQQAGFETSLPPDDPDGQERALPEQDAQAVVAASQATPAACALVDHYGVTEEYVRYLADAGLLVALIDDMAEQELGTVRWLLNQNLGASALPYPTFSGRAKLLGPRYALLRPEFARARATLSRQFSLEDRNVLVTLGGGDTVELSRAVLEALELVRSPLKVRCIGRDRSDDLSAQLGGAGAASRHEVTLLDRVTDMAQQMAWADLSVNAGGSTCWELCCLGVPMVVLVTSRDQASVASELERAGCARNLGEWQRNGHRSELARSVEELLANPLRRSEMSRKGQSLVDGLGAERAAESLLSMVEAAGANAN